MLGKLFQAMGMFAGQAQSGFEAVDEQGYRGYRFRNPAMEGGLVHGQGHMLLALGTGVLEKMLSTLNNPPRGTASLRGSKVFARAKQLMDLREGISFQLMDGERASTNLGRVLEMSLSQMDTARRMSGDTAGAAMIMKILRELIPDREEMKGILGPAVSTVHLDDRGMVGLSVIDLPAP